VTVKERGGRERVFTVFLLKYHRLSSGQLKVGFHLSEPTLSAFFETCLIRPEIR
jgi:hypothetical protein